MNFPLNELGNFPTKFGAKFTTLVQISRLDWQLRNEIAKFVANVGNLKWTSETVCQKYCETHCNALRCSVVHPGHRISLQCFRYFAHFLRLTSSIASAASSVNWLGCPNSIALDVRTDIWTSSSTYRKGQLFRVLSTSRITSFSSCYHRFPFPMDLHRLCFMTPIDLSNWPHHHDARLRLNCHAIPCLASRSLSFSSFLIFLNHFAAAMKVFQLSQKIFPGCPCLAISCLILWMNSSTLRLGRISRYTARVRQCMHTAQRKLSFLFWTYSGT